MRVNTAPDRAKGQKFQVRDERQGRGAPQTRKRRNNRLLRAGHLLNRSVTQPVHNVNSGALSSSNDSSRTSSDESIVRRCGSS